MAHEYLDYSRHALQRGKLALVTAANSGLGYETALALAQARDAVVAQLTSTAFKAA